MSRCTVPYDEFHLRGGRSPLFLGVRPLARTAVPKLLFPLGASSPGRLPPNPRHARPLRSPLILFPSSTRLGRNQSSRSLSLSLFLSLGWLFRAFTIPGLYPDGVGWPKGRLARDTPNRRAGIEKKRLHGAYRCLRGEINGGDGAATAAIGVRLFRITLAL